MLDHYLHTAQAAARLLCPGRDLLTLPRPGRGAAERSGSAARWPGSSPTPVCRRPSPGAEPADPAWQLGWILGRYLHRSGYWQEWLAHLAHRPGRRRTRRGPGRARPTSTATSGSR
jgi:hypothetical protein